VAEAIDDRDPDAPETISQLAADAPDGEIYPEAVDDDDVRRLVLWVNESLDESTGDGHAETRHNYAKLEGSAFSGREREVVALRLTGLSHAEIAWFYSVLDDATDGDYPTSKSTVDEYSTRAAQKRRVGYRTAKVAESLYADQHEGMLCPSCGVRGQKNGEYICRVETCGVEMFHASSDWQTRPPVFAVGDADCPACDEQVGFIEGGVAERHAVVCQNAECRAHRLTVDAEPVLDAE
jgi:hypothetical protein